MEKTKEVVTSPLQRRFMVAAEKKKATRKATFFTSGGTRNILNRYGLISLLEKWRLSGIVAVLSTHKYGYKLKINSVGWIIKGETVEELIENLKVKTDKIRQIE